MVPNMQLVKEVCEENRLSFVMLGKKGNILELKKSKKKYFFTYTTTPFNTEDVQHICNDKFITYQILESNSLMPRTKKYLRPDLDPAWHDTLDFSSLLEIISDIKDNFKFPFIIKMNSGSLGRNVFKCENNKDIEKAVKMIFKEDWALLAQELVEKHKEFRVMIVNNSVELVYTKGGSNFYYKGDKVFEDTKKFLVPLKRKINLGWAGLDVVLDKKKKLHLVEINTKPSLISAVRSGKKQEAKSLYKKALREILK